MANRTRHNPERKTFRGRSYKAAGRRVAALKEVRHVDFDEESACWGIFGVTSGFCYGLYSSEQEAALHV